MSSFCLVFAELLRPVLIVGGFSSKRLLREAPITSGADLFGRSVCLCVCDSRDFVILPKGIWALDRVQFSSVLWPEKCLPYFSGPKSYPQLRTFKSYRTTVRGPKTGPSFWTLFCTFFEKRTCSLAVTNLSHQLVAGHTSSHVRWSVIVRRRLRAPCLQVLSSKMF